MGKLKAKATKFFSKQILFVCPQNNLVFKAPKNEKKKKNN